MLVNRVLFKTNSSSRQELLNVLHCGVVHLRNCFTGLRSVVAAAVTLLVRVLFRSVTSTAGLFSCCACSLDVDVKLWAIASIASRYSLGRLPRRFFKINPAE